MRYRVIVVEATGGVPGVDPDTPCFFISVRGQSATRAPGLPTRLPDWVKDASPVLRTALMPRRTFADKQSARNKKRTLVRQLVRKGWFVNLKRHTYSLYVIELRPPARHPEDAPVPLYVGQTSKPIEERFKEHMEGGKRASRKVFRRGIRLRRDLILDQQDYYFQDDAIKAETRLGIRLQKRGHRIYGPQNMPRPS